MSIVEDLANKIDNEPIDPHGAEGAEGIITEPLENEDPKEEFASEDDSGGNDSGATPANTQNYKSWKDAYKETDDFKIRDIQIREERLKAAEAEIEAMKKTPAWTLYEESKTTGKPFYEVMQSYIEEDTTAITDDELIVRDMVASGKTKREAENAVDNMDDYVKTKIAKDLRKEVELENKKRRDKVSTKADTPQLTPEDKVKIQKAEKDLNSILERMWSVQKVGDVKVDAPMLSKMERLTEALVGIPELGLIDKDGNFNMLEAAELAFMVLNPKVVIKNIFKKGEQAALTEAFKAKHNPNSGRYTQKSPTRDTTTEHDVRHKKAVDIGAQTNAFLKLKWDPGKSLIDNLVGTSN